MRCLSEEMKDVVVVQKVLQSLPSKYNAKVFAIEEASDLSKLKIDDFHGILTACEMRLVLEGGTKREAAFKSTKKAKEENSNSDSSKEGVLAYLVKKLKRSFGKRKGKLPLKCFNYGRTRHFAAKCPYDKDDEDNEEGFRKKYKGQSFFKLQNFSKKKKSLCIKEDNSNLENSEDSSAETLFMALGTITTDLSDEELQDDEDGEISLEGELLCAL